MTKPKQSRSSTSSGERKGKVQLGSGQISAASDLMRSAGSVLTASSGGKNSSSPSGRLLLRDSVTGEMQSRAGVAVIEALKSTGFTNAEIYQLVVSKRSLERRQQKDEPLSAAESDRALRLARIHEHAVRVFGSEEKASRWLRKPCRALDGAIPLDLLASETGAHIVDSELHAIDHGMFA